MMQQYVYLFPFLFVGIFVLVIFILSKKGWADLAEVYAYNEPFEGGRAGITSMTINGVNYNNCLLLNYCFAGAPAVDWRQSIELRLMKTC